MGWKNDWYWECYRIHEVHCPPFVSDDSGYINLPRLFPAFGETQFQILCVLAPVSLVTTAIITCICIKEVDPKLLFTFPGQEQEESKGGTQAALSVSP